MDAVQPLNRMLAESDEQDSTTKVEYLSFNLANELYGIAIEDVEEIRVWERPTPIPRSPLFVKGVINLRGMIVPVMDLRQRFSVGECVYLPTTVVIVLRHRFLEQQRLMGIVVDAVSDVVSLSTHDINRPVGDTPVSTFMLGLVNVGEHVMTLLDTSELMDIESFQEAS
ncbi:chemotaxis protein CheW [Vibrio sp. 05-20-BW147]|uniref:chemotaxis protein CheW n=2 Tax=Vibrio TaxID=662 RepID=UPI001592CD18|nr:purine-binding chemotaxis protein CheW [Vibrio sp. 05-20-BW147]